MKVLILDEFYRTPPMSGGDRALWDIQRSLTDLHHDVVITNRVDALDDFWDVVMVSRPLLAARVHKAARRAAHRAIYLGHDLHHQRLAFPDSVPPGQPRPVSVMRTVERTCWAAYDLSVYPTQQEVEVVLEAGFAARQFPYFRVDPRDDPPMDPPINDGVGSGVLTLLFVGGSLHTPNVSGLRWFSNRILSELRPEPPMVHVVGQWDAQLQDEFTGPQVKFLGPLTPERLDRQLVHSSAIIAPLTAGAGLKAKVIDALASGRPLIATSVAMQGIDDPWSMALPGHTLADWQRAIRLISNDSALTDRLAKAGLTYVNRHHGSDAYLQATADLLL